MAYGKCFLSGVEGLVERHHIFGGALRSKSERYGLVVELSPWMHRNGPKAAHRCWETRVRLCKYGQRKAMLEQGWDLDTWLQEFGRNWLEDYEISEIEELQKAEDWRGEPKEWIREEPERKTRIFQFTVTAEELPF